MRRLEPEANIVAAAKAEGDHTAQFGEAISRVHKPEPPRDVKIAARARTQREQRPLASTRLPRRAA